MKTRLLYLLTALGVLFTTAILAQCPTGNVSFNSQAEVDAFGTNFPNCTTINGSIFMENTNDITDLSPLGNITSVSGSIKIDNLNMLNDLSGLGNITSVEGFC